MRHVQKKTERYSLTSGIGVKLRLPVDCHMKVRGRAAIPLKNWLARFTETMLWYESKCIGATTQIDLEREAGENLLFRSASAATWLNDTDIFTLSQNFLLFYQIGYKSSLTWQAGISGSREGGKTVADNYSLSASFKNNFYKDYLYYEIQPGVTYPRDNNFHSRPYIKMMLDIFFEDT